MGHEIVYHGEITSKGVSQVQRILTQLLPGLEQEVIKIGSYPKKAACTWWSHRRERLLSSPNSSR